MTKAGKDEMTIREIGRKGGLSRAAQYDDKTLRRWSAKGGIARRDRHTSKELRRFARNAGRRPYKLTDGVLKRLQEMLAAGKAQAEIAKRLGVSLRTVGRFVSSNRKSNVKA